MSALTALADAMQVAAAAVTGIQASYQGKKRIADGALEDAVRSLTAETKGYFWFSLADRTILAQTQVGTATFKGELAVSLPKDTTSTVDTAYNLAEAVAVALSVEATFVSTGCRPSRITFRSAAPEDDRLEDGVLIFEFEMVYTLPPVC